MYDHSYNLNTLTNVLRKGDFPKNMTLSSMNAFRISTANAATQSALNIFNGINPITIFHLKKKSAYKIEKLEDDLVVRKLSLNLKQITKTSSRGRSFLVTNLRHFLEEGVPYKVYRLDIKSFYESFVAEEIKKKTLSLRKLSPLSKQHLEALLDFYTSISGQGLPRGMALSAVLSDFMMSEFDSETLQEPEVFYYGRYVDDIIIITNNNESTTTFIDRIKQRLPKGLHLNEKKKTIISVPKIAKRMEAFAKPDQKFSFDYLGYRFPIFDSQKKGNGIESDFRLVNIEISPSKIKKIKLRIIRALIEFHKTKDTSLLIERIKYLTSNFSVIDKNTGKRKLAGIYHSYPLLSPDATSLTELDQFLRNAVLSKKGGIFSKTSRILVPWLKRILLAQSFRTGHINRRFIYFSSTKISRIQECWINE